MRPFRRPTLIAPSVAQLPKLPETPSTPVDDVETLSDWDTLPQECNARNNVEPAAALCEAAGLEVAVLSWWHSAPGRPHDGRPRGEDLWLRSAVAGGEAAGATVRLLRSGVPVRVVEAGRQLGHFLAADEEVRHAWTWHLRDTQARSGDFTARLVSRTLTKYQVQSVPLFLQEWYRQPGLLLTPRPPSTPLRKGWQRSPRSARSSPPPPRASSSLAPQREDASPLPDAPRVLSGLPVLDSTWNAAASSESAAFTETALYSGKDSQCLPSAILSTAAPDDSLDSSLEVPSAHAYTRCLRSARSRQTASRSTASQTDERFSATCADPETDADAEGTNLVRHQRRLKKGTGTGGGNGYVRAQTFTFWLQPQELPSLSPRESGTVEEVPGIRQRAKTAFAEPLGTTKRRELFREEGSSSSPLAEIAPLTPAVRRHTKKKTTTQSSFQLWMQVKSSKNMKQIEEREGKEKKKDLAKEGVDLTPMVKAPTKKGAQKVVRDLVEVRRLFDNFDEDSSGYIEKHEFLPLIAQLLKQPKSEMDLSEVWRHWDQVDNDGSGQLSFDEFQKWYCTVFGIDGTPDFTRFFTEDLVDPEQAEVREVAKKLNMNLVDAEKIWTEFNRLDNDASGCLEKSEVEELIKKQLASAMKRRHKLQPEVPPQMLNKFWQDIDTDGNGSVTFEEFATWYNKSFVGDQSPMEQYYNNLGSGYRSHRKGTEPESSFPR